MSLDKAIASGKELRQPYRKSQRFDVTCRNHGSCAYCELGRKHSTAKRLEAARQRERDYRNDA